MSAASGLAGLLEKLMTLQKDMGAELEAAWRNRLFAARLREELGREVARSRQERLQRRSESCGQQQSRPHSYMDREAPAPGFSAQETLRAA